MGVIFFSTSLLSKIHNTSMILKQNNNNARKEILNNSSKQVAEKESKKHTEKIKYILDISETLGEALNYIKQNYKNDTKSQVKIVLNDSIVAVNSINNALVIIYSDLDNKNIKSETRELASLLTKLMKSLDENNIRMVETIINSKLSNEYNRWKSDIENEFR